MSDSHSDTNGSAPGAGDARSNASKKAQTQPATVSSGVGASGQRPAGATPPPPPPGKPAAPAQSAPAQKKAPAKKSAPRKNAAAPKQGTSNSAASQPAPPKQAPSKQAPQNQAASKQAPPPQAPSTTAARSGQNQKAPQGAGSHSPLTAADYAGTTRGSADTTSVMPAIRDEPAPGAAQTAQQPAVPAAPAGSGRRAKLRLKHIEPWSVTRLAFVVTVALMIVAVVAVTIFWIVLDITGVWDQLNGSVTNVLADDSGDFDVTDYLGLGRLVGLTLVLSAINVIITTALATIAAHLYNLSAQLLGGVELTFGED